MALASRLKSVPVVVRTSQPRPTVTAVRPGASLVSETLPPLDRLTAMVGSPSLVAYGFVRGFVRARSYSYPYERSQGCSRFPATPRFFTFFTEPALAAVTGSRHRDIRVTWERRGREHGGHVRSPCRPRLRLPARGRAHVAFLAVLGTGRAARQHQ